MWLQAIALLCASKKGIQLNQLHRMLGDHPQVGVVHVAPHPRGHARWRLMPPMGGAGGIVEIDETIYGRAATHPKGRGPFGAKITNSAHKNVMLSLVERGGEVRSYHIDGSTVARGHSRS